MAVVGLLVTGFAGAGRATFERSAALHAAAGRPALAQGIDEDLRLGRWGRVVDASEAAWRTSITTVGRDSRAAPDYQSARRLVYALLQQGRYRAAARVVDDASHRTASAVDPMRALAGRRAVWDMQARLALERHAWLEAAALPPGPEGEQAASIPIWFARGVGAARAAGRGERPARLDRALEAARSLEARANESKDPAALAGLAVRAAIAAAQDERDEMRLLLQQAAWIADARPDGARIPEPPIPVHELAGDLWLLVDRYDDAVREYRLALERNPRRARSTLGLARALSRTGERMAARDAYAAFLEICKDADPDLPETAEARAFTRR